MDEKIERASVYEYDGKYLIHPDDPDFCELAHEVGEPCICQIGDRLGNIYLPSNFMLVTKSFIEDKKYLDSERASSSALLGDALPPEAASAEVRVICNKLVPANTMVVSENLFDAIERAAKKL